MSVNSPFAKLEELKPDPERRERWCFERLAKEWPNAEVSKEVKAIMFFAAAFVDEEGPMSQATHELGRIATALEKIAGIDQ